MKLRPSLIMLFLIQSILGYGQKAQSCVFGFDTWRACQGDTLIIDTLNPSNEWEIGIPQKTVFNNGAIPTKAIVTNLTSPYGINDTSSFQIFHRVDKGLPSGNFSLVVDYQINSDTLADFGEIEFSPNNGKSWVNLTKDTILYNQGAYYFLDELNAEKRPTLSGNTNGWSRFSLFIPKIQLIFNVQQGDTVIFKFNFYSDSIYSLKDGWALDNITVFDRLIGGVQGSQIRNNKVLIYPNPFNTSATIIAHNNFNKAQIKLVNVFGEVLKEINNINGRELNLDREKLANGLYFLYITEDDREYNISRIVISD